MSVKESVLRLWQSVLQILFPKRCPICHDIVELQGQLICPGCRRKLIYVLEPKCKKCGKPLQNERHEYCQDCLRTEHFYKRGLSLFVCDQTMKQSIYYFKNGKRIEYAEFYGKEIVKYFGTQIKEWHAKALIPIPLHKSKLKKRGFNQSELLAEEISKQLNIPVNHKLVVCTQKTPEQKSLKRVNRQNNLKKAFKITENDVKLDTVILVDDVYTTGSTIDAVAKLLQNHGIVNIYFITLAVGQSL